MSGCSKQDRLFNDLVGAGEQRGLNAKVEAAKIEAASDAKIILLV